MRVSKYQVLVSGQAFAHGVVDPAKLVELFVSKGFNPETVRLKEFVASNKKRKQADFVNTYIIDVAVPLSNGTPRSPPQDLLDSVPTGAYVYNTNEKEVSFHFKLSWIVCIIQVTRMQKPICQAPR